MDIWDSNAAAVPGSRSGVIGTAFIAGVCSTNKYSIVEYGGLNSIQNAAHELGHRQQIKKNIYILRFLFVNSNFSLGAVHDQTGTAISCLASNNHIMTSSLGAYTNATNMFYFSNCSINSFKQTLLTPDYK